MCRGIVSWMFARKRPAAKAPSLWDAAARDAYSRPIHPSLEKRAARASCPMPPPRAQLRFLAIICAS